MQGLTATLQAFQPQKPFLVAVDSDGTVFDTMTQKHKQVFPPLAVEIWELDAIADEFTAAAEDINLYSMHRGINRFPGLLMTFDRIKQRDPLPNYEALRRFCNDTTEYSNASLEAYGKQHPDKFLDQLLEWSRGGDARMKTLAQQNRPFPGVEDVLKAAKTYADIVVVSAASTAALRHEWGNCGLDRYVTAIAGQEAGGKSRQLSCVTRYYAPQNAIMIGDAPGDRTAAKEHGICFYPIVPGREEDSWQELHNEALARFLRGEYAGAYEQRCTDAYLAQLTPDR